MRMPSGVMALGSFSGPAVSYFAWSFISYMGCNGVKSPVHVRVAPFRTVSLQCWYLIFGGDFSSATGLESGVLWKVSSCEEGR